MGSTYGLNVLITFGYCLINPLVGLICKCTTSHFCRKCDEKGQRCSMEVVL
jgi:hypothetical protein